MCLLTHGTPAPGVLVDPQVRKGAEWVKACHSTTCSAAAHRICARQWHAAPSSRYNSCVHCGTGRPTDGRGPTVASTRALEKLDSGLDGEPSQAAMTAGVIPSPTTPTETDTIQHGDRPFRASMTAGFSASQTSPGDKPSGAHMTARVTPGLKSPQKPDADHRHIDEPLEGSMTAGSPTGSTSETAAGKRGPPASARETLRSGYDSEPPPNSLPVIGERLTG